MSENLCRDIGCEAMCCKSGRDRYLEFRGDVEAAFPSAQKVDYYDLSDIGVPGVFYTSYRGEWLIRIIGPCPNLDDKLNCKIYPNHPAACNSGMVLGSKECLAFRKRK